MDGESESAQNARVESLWASLDTHKTGQLDHDGLREGLKRIKHPLANADDLLDDVLRALDTNGDGRIEYPEFRTFVRRAEKELWRLFKTIDEDKNNGLSKIELYHAFSRAGITAPHSKLDDFFSQVDANNDGVISFDEWRNFLLFIPTDVPGLKAVLSYYSASVKLNAEGDVNLSDETVQGLGYFVAGGVAGMISRTSTAPLDRLKVYLIAQTGNTSKALEAAKTGDPVQATKRAARPIVDACKHLWAAGGIRSLFAGNGLNVAKVIPESGIKFGSYEASKRALATFEGHNDPTRLQPLSQFIAGGVGGMISQFAVYPVDTLKFRMQCETVKGGLRGNALIVDTAKKLWQRQGFRGLYRGLPMGLVGMFPYAAIDLGTFEYLKQYLIRRNISLHGISEEDAQPGSFATAIIGACSGALGASLVYPLNLLRTRLQTQGTVVHPRTYDGMVDVFTQTVKGEGVKGLFKGLTPNLFKVVPSVSITYVVYENMKKTLNVA